MAIKFDKTQMEETIAAMQEEYRIPGLAVGIGTGREGLLLDFVSGIRSISGQEPLSRDHFFHVASVTKLFTGTAIMQLYEQGRLGLDQKVCRLLPWFHMDNSSYREITVRRLLSHTSGMGDCYDYQWDHPWYDDGALKRFVLSDDVAKKPMIQDPALENPSFHYSNNGYEILGAIVAEAGGVTYEAYVEENILRPLGMNRSTLLTFQRDRKTLCDPHGINADGTLFLYEHFPYNRAHSPSSTLTTNTGDLSKFAEAYLQKSNRLFTRQETFAEMLEPQGMVPNNGETIGLSWFVRRQEDKNGRLRTLQGHEGNDDGFRASLWLCPEADVYVIVTSNLNGSPVKKINKRIFSLLDLPI